MKPRSEFQDCLKDKNYVWEPGSCYIKGEIDFCKKAEGIDTLNNMMVGVTILIRSRKETKGQGVQSAMENIESTEDILTPNLRRQLWVKKLHSSE